MENLDTAEPHLDILKDLFNPDTSDYLRFPQYNAQLTTNSNKSPENCSKRLQYSAPPQIMINDQFGNFDQYNWHLSTFASAFSNLQVSFLIVKNEQHMAH